MHPSQFADLPESNVPLDRSNSGNYRGVRWSVRLAPFGLRDVTGDPILAHATLASGDRSWTGWLVENGEFAGGVCFSFLDVSLKDVLPLWSNRRKRPGPRNSSGHATDPSL